MMRKKAHHRKGWLRSGTRVSVAVLMIALGPGSVLAQVPQGSFGRAQISLPDGNVYSVENLTIEGERLAFRNLTKPSVTELTIDQVTRIRAEQRVKNWAQVASYSGIFAGSALGGLLATDGIDNGPAIVVGFAFAGAGLGLLLAGHKRVWKDIYRRDSTAAKIGGIRFVFDPAARRFGLSIALF